MRGVRIYGDPGARTSDSGACVCVLRCGCGFGFVCFGLGWGVGGLSGLRGCRTGGSLCKVCAWSVWSWVGGCSRGRCDLYVYSVHTVYTENVSTQYVCIHVCARGRRTGVGAHEADVTSMHIMYMQYHVKYVCTRTTGRGGCGGCARVCGGTPLVRTARDLCGKSCGKSDMICVANAAQGTRARAFDAVLTVTQS